jgi:hypothetical protein
VVEHVDLNTHLTSAPHLALLVDVILYISTARHTQERLTGVSFMCDLNIAVECYHKL